MKKLLIATSALALAAPAVAEVSLSGKLEMSATTTDAQSATAGTTAAELALAVSDGTISGGTTLVIDNGDVTAKSNKVSATTGVGTFTLGGSALMADDDLTELALIGDVGDVGALAGSYGVASYSNTFGDLKVGLSWGASAAATSLGFDFGGFAVTVDADQANNYVLNATGDFGGAGVKLEYASDADYDLAVTSTLGDMGITAGSNSKGNSELGISTTVNGAAVGITSATVDGAAKNKLTLGTTVGDYATTLTLNDNAGTQTSSVKITLAPGVTLEMANSGAATLALKMAF